MYKELLLIQVILLYMKIVTDKPSFVCYNKCNVSKKERIRIKGMIK